MGLDLSVVVITKDRGEDLIECLESIVNQTAKPLEVIIVDASKETNTKDLIASIGQRKKFPLKYIPQHRGGIASARNIGAKAARGAVIAFVDDDTTLKTDYLERIKEIYDKDCGELVGGVAGVPSNETVSAVQNFLCKIFMISYHGSDGRLLPSGYFTYYTPAASVMRVWHLGVNMSFRRQVFDTFKFDEMFNYNEDVCFSHWVSRRYYLVVTPYARFIHKQNRPGGGGDPTYKYMRRTYDHYKFFMVEMNWSLKNNLFFIWSQLGHILGYSILAAIHPRPVNFKILRGVIEGNLMIFRDLRRALSLRNRPLSSSPQTHYASRRMVS